MFTHLTGGLCCWRGLQDGIHAAISLRSFTVRLIVLIHSKTTAPRVQHRVLAVTLGWVQAMVPVLVLELGLLTSHGALLEVAEDVR